jgi:NAD(P)-dependent dehydrogenase (short-subunit alcohol dehydrogenase family)
MRLKDQVVVVTGAGRGIGEQLVWAFCREGARVILAARNFSEIESVAANLKAEGFSSLAVTTDAQEEPSIRSLFQKTRDTFGEVDVLVNNAGVSFVKPLVETEADEWDNLMQANLRSVYLCCREALKGMIPRRRGVILNVSSGLAHKGYPDLTAYCASKAGLEGLSLALALELEPHGIRVHTLHPGGVVRTAMGIENVKLIPAFTPAPEGQWLPADILCDAALYLASDENSKVTGLCIKVDRMGWRKKAPAEWLVEQTSLVD